MDKWGDHAVHYSSEVGVKFRHNLVRDILVDICSKVGIMVKKEAPMGFRSGDGKDLRPANLFLFNWLQGKDACLDVTGISPFAGMGAKSWAPAVALLNAVEKKKKKYASICEDNGYKFIPFAFSTFGEFDKDALDTLLRIKSNSISHSNNVKSGEFIFHRNVQNVNFSNYVGPSPDYPILCRRCYDVIAGQPGRALAAVDNKPRSEHVSSQNVLQQRIKDVLQLSFLYETAFDLVIVMRDSLSLSVLQYFYTHGSTCESYVNHPTLCGRCYDVIAGQPPCVLSVVSEALGNVLTNINLYYLGYVLS
ncbi:hypothetical protein Tco_0881231 [Tanacetum coccineum]